MGENMKTIRINTPYIKLEQMLKLANISQSGGEAKLLIKNGKLKVNGETELRRGKKLKAGDLVSFGNNEYIVRQDGGIDGDKEASS